MAKSKALRQDVMVRIGQAKKKHPNVSIRLLAQEFGCTEHQARWAVKQYNEGYIGGVKAKNQAKVEKMKKEAEGKSAFEILKEQAQAIAIQVEIDEKMTLKEKTALIKDITLIVKSLKSSDIHGNIKDPDVERIAIMVRLLKPELTDKEIIELWNRAVEIHKA